jgi:hypothetical protein
MEDTVCVQTPLGEGEGGREDGEEEGVEEDGLFAVFDGHQGEEGGREGGKERRYDWTAPLLFVAFSHSPSPPSLPPSLQASSVLSLRLII